MGNRNELLEAELRSHFDRGDHAAFATGLIQGYGPELLGFVAGLLCDETRGREAFSIFCEDLWRGIPRFQYACSARTWAYTLARHAASRRRREGKRDVPLSEAASTIMNAVATGRSTTEIYVQTEVKDRFRRLRERLDEEDQVILCLRIDRGHSWAEIAQVLAGPERTPAPGELALGAARLRQQMQSIKSKLRRLAEREGLLVRP